MTIKSISQFKGVIMIGVLLGTCTGCVDSDSGQVWSTRQEPQRADRRATSLGTTGPIAFDGDRGTMRDAAVQILRNALHARTPELRAMAIQGLHQHTGELESAVLAGLGDENRGVRFVAVMTVGKFRLKNLSHLVMPLLRDESESVRAAAIYALHRCGENVDVNPLGQMIVSANPEVKGNAAFVLGELGNSSAIPMLRRAAGRGMSRIHVTHAQIVDMQIAEAIVKLGEERELDVIRAALFAPFEKAEVVAFACQICGQLNDGRAVPNLTDLAMREGERKSPPEVRMAATMALAQISSGQPNIEVPLEYATSDRMELRSQAAMTLGAIRSPVALTALHQLLSDSNPLVQVSAAAGIMQHLGE